MDILLEGDMAHPRGATTGAAMRVTLIPCT
jgi:hypothetical protein